MNHISTVRQHLLDQLAALRSATPEALKDELARAKGVSELAQTITNTAKVEVDYLVATGQSSTPFLEVPPDTPYLRNNVATLPSGAQLPARQHRLKG